jgi:hypothetical protein
MFPRMKRHRPLVGPAILFVGILVCVSVQYSPWWATNAIVDENGQPAYCENYWTTVFPTGTYFTQCSGSSPPSSPVNHQALDTPHVTGVAEVSADATLLGGLLAGLAILLAVLPRPGRHPRRGLALAVLTLGLLATVAAFAGAAYFQEALPGAWHSDNYTYQTGDPIQPSFSGHNEIMPHPNDSSVTESWTWGPAIGWYLAWVAGALILAGSLLAWRTLWRDPDRNPA